MTNRGISHRHCYTRMNLWDIFNLFPKVLKLSRSDMHENSIMICIVSWGKYRDVYRIMRWLYCSEELLKTTIWWKFWDNFSYFSIKTCCGYSLEAPCRGTSNEYPQHMLWWRTGENYPRIITKYSFLTIPLIVTALLLDWKTKSILSRAVLLEKLVYEILGQLP